MSGERFVVSGGDDGSVRLWDPRAAGDRGRQLGRHDGEVWAVAFTGEGLVVSGGDDGAVVLWDPRASGDPGRELFRHDGAITAVTVTSDGQLSVLTYGGITTFEMTTAFRDH